jgi:hypothetical protein
MENLIKNQPVYPPNEKNQFLLSFAREKYIPFYEERGKIAILYFTFTFTI